MSLCVSVRVCACERGMRLLERPQVMNAGNQEVRTLYAITVGSTNRRVHGEQARVTLEHPTATAVVSASSHAYVSE